MADNETPPIVVPATPGPDVIAASVRLLVMAIGVVTAFAGFVSKRDLAGFITYIQSSDFLAAAGGISAAVAAIWALLKTQHRSIQLTNTAKNPLVPDSVIKVEPK